MHPFGRSTKFPGSLLSLLLLSGDGLFGPSSASPFGGFEPKEPAAPVALYEVCAGGRLAVATATDSRAQPGTKAALFCSSTSAENALLLAEAERDCRALHAWYAKVQRRASGAREDLDALASYHGVAVAVQHVERLTRGFASSATQEGLRWAHDNGHVTDVIAAVRHNVRTSTGMHASETPIPKELLDVLEQLQKPLELHDAAVLEVAREAGFSPTGYPSLEKVPHKILCNWTTRNGFTDKVVAVTKRLMAEAEAKEKTAKPEPKAAVNREPGHEPFRPGIDGELPASDPSLRKRIVDVASPARPSKQAVPLLTVAHVEARLGAEAAAAIAGNGVIHEAVEYAVYSIGLAFTENSYWSSLIANLATGDDVIPADFLALQGLAADMAFARLATFYPSVINGNGAAIFSMVDDTIDRFLHAKRD